MKKFLVSILISALAFLSACTPVDNPPKTVDNIDIQVSSPLPDTKVDFPLTITGQAKGYWFFEGIFHVKLVDMNNNELSSAQVNALGDWMTEDFVQFEAVIPTTKLTTIVGKLIFENDNPSGLPKNAKSFEVPVNFK